MVGSRRAWQRETVNAAAGLPELSSFDRACVEGWLNRTRREHRLTVFALQLLGVVLGLIGVVGFAIGLLGGAFLLGSALGAGGKWQGIFVFGGCAIMALAAIPALLFTNRCFAAAWVRLVREEMHAAMLKPVCPVCGAAYRLEEPAEAIWCQACQARRPSPSAVQREIERASVAAKNSS